MLTGKPAFDALAAAIAPFIGQSFNYQGNTYTVSQADSVTGPYSAKVVIDGFYADHEILAPGVSALVVRYQAEGNKKVDPVSDMRVLTSISIPDNPTNADLVALGKQFLEDAR